MKKKSLTDTSVARDGLSPLEPTPVARFCALFTKGSVLAKKYHAVTVLSAAFLAAVVALIGYYILFPSRAYFHSDSADTQMWAKAAYDAGALLNPDFEYACLLPIGGQLLMVPLMAIFGVSMTTQVIGMLLFFLLFAASLVFLFRQMRWSWKATCFSTGLTLLLLSTSEKLREIFWGHVIYYSLGLLFLTVGLGLTFWVMRLLSETPPARRSLAIAGSLLGVWSLLGAINQFEILTLFSVPLLVALAAERFFDFSKALSSFEKRGSAVLIVGIGIATVIGYLLGGVIAGDLVGGYASAFSSFGSPDNWFSNLGLFFNHWASLFGVTMQDGVPLASLDSILQLVMMIASVVLLVAPVIAALLYAKIDDRPTRVLILAHWVVSGLILIGFIFGRLAAANWRLSPMLATSALVTLALCRWCVRAHPAKKRLTMIAVVPLLIAGAMTVNTIVAMPPNLYDENAPFANTHSVKLHTLAAAMEERGWDYGYATFWNANALTVISDSAIECRCIELTDEYRSYQPRYYQQERAWFEDQEGQDTYFVLLETAEYNHMLTAGNPLITEAVDTLQAEEFYILLFDHNIFPVS